MDDSVIDQYRLLHMNPKFSPGVILERQYADEVGKIIKETGVTNEVGRILHTVGAERPAVSCARQKNLRRRATGLHHQPRHLSASASRDRVPPDSASTQTTVWISYA